ncbi:hypothetical protein [Planctomyces sp. SH-PL14]|uniref:hypothetical protein n=1 Tax=Planctomyces sp. SH-PL14 TaxID=1632864 RepID=UPI00078B4C53|nr:hypothetical protein [Planctomyces sp. SH-PL14]AMV17424.1 hypothetical protein VT03_06000 [Planctomyces sp. SH-PL14]
MSDVPELGLFQWIIGGVVAGGIAVAAYLNGRINGVSDGISGNELDLAMLRLHVSENYTTKEELRSLRAETNHSLDRIHSRIDDVDDSIQGMPEKIVTIMRGNT